jgi:hypothetical protein
MDQQDIEENFIMNSFIIYACSQILSRELNQRGCAGLLWARLEREGKRER